MKTKIILIIGLALGLSAFTASAQGGPGGGRGWGRGASGCPTAMALLDTNKDGRISAVEAQGTPAALNALDKYRYGKVTANGTCPWRGNACPAWTTRGRGRGCPWRR